MIDRVGVTGTNVSNDGPVDFAIITALRVERSAVLQRLDNGYQALQYDLDPLTYYSGYVTIPGKSEKYSVVVVTLLGMGNDEAAIATTRVIDRWKPASVLMVGIAGGVKGKVELGDVVAAEYVFYYEMAKVLPGGEQLRPQQFRSDMLLYGRAQAYEDKDWKGDIGQLVPEDSLPVRVPDAHFGPIGSGEKVIADAASLQDLIDACPKLLAVAMEGAGVARAATHAPNPPRFMEVRGICDFADEQKDDRWHAIAANAAAAFSIGLLRDRPIPPLQRSDVVSAKAAPILIIREESLRQIGPAEVLYALGGDIRERDIETVQLDFTNLVAGGVVTDPEEAARLLVDPGGPLRSALLRHAGSDLVFHGLAHVPLLVLTGHIVTDRQPVRLFDFHPNIEAGTWKWPAIANNGYPALTVRGFPKRPSKSVGEAVIRVSVSYRVTPEQMARVVGAPVFAMDIEVPSPERGVVTSEAQVRSYGRVFRQTLDEIANKHQNVERVHLFYAGPVSLAFHIGQQISENIHPPVVVWNYHRTYDWAIDLSKATINEPSIVRMAVE